MASNQQQQQSSGGEGLTSDIVGMSKSQLYEIMSQMKVMIEQNQQQARQILIDNPRLTRAVFHAQIMLGMVKPQSMTSSQSTQLGHQPSVQTTQPLPVQLGLQGQTSSSQPVVPPRQHHQSQPSISLPTVSAPPLTFQLQSMPSNPLHYEPQTEDFLNAQIPFVEPTQSSPNHNVPLPLPPAPPHYSVLQSQMPMVSGQTQQFLPIPGLLHQPLQTPLPQQPRLPSMQPFSHQLHSEMPHGLGFQPPSAHQPLLSQPLFHSGGNPPSFPPGQPPLLNQPPLQQLYQGGLHLGSDYGNQAGTSLQAERAPWIPGLQAERATGSPQFLGPPLLVAGQMARPEPLTPDMEKVLLQQVMSLTPEQINLLPPEQRQQVFQLREMLQ